MENSQSNGALVERRALIRRGDEAREPQPMVLQVDSGDETSSGTLSFNALWHAFIKRVWVALPLGAVLAGIACAALGFVTEPKYKSVATLKIVDKQPYVAFKTSDPSREFAETQVELLRGPFIISRAIDSENLQELPELRDIAGREDPVVWIGQRLKAVRIGKSELYEVSFIGKYPESSGKVVQAIVDTYMRFQTSESDTQRQRVLELLSEEQAVRDHDIDMKREKLKELTKQAGGDDAIVLDVGRGKASSKRSVGKSGGLLSNLQDKLVTAEVETEVLRAKVAALREEQGRNTRTADANVDTTLEEDPRIAKLKLEMYHKQATLRTLAATAPQRARIEDDIKKIERDLSESKEHLRQQNLKDAEGQVFSGRQDALSKAEKELAGQQRMAAMLREKIDSERGEQAEHGDKSLELEFARSELESAEEIRRLIADRAIHLTTESRAPGQVQIVQKPKTPQFPEGPSLGKKMGMLGFVVFLAPFGLFLGWDMLHRRIYEREQLEQECELTIVSEIAALPARPLFPKPGGNRAYELQSHLYEESVNALRTTLTVNEKLKNKGVFVVASAVSGEGKTNLSTQLAMSWSLAIEGRVLIVDADLRSPNVHDLFDIRSEPGLAEVLRGECALEDAIVMDWGDRLFVLPAGVAKGNSPSHLFSGPRFFEILSQMRSQFDKVIIDVAPVLCASETLMIAKQADGVLLCARHDYSQAGQVKQAYAKLTAAGVNVVGGVLNGAPTRKYSYYYRGYATV